jgi:voltage-gated potassium channel
MAESLSPMRRSSAIRQWIFSVTSGSHPDDRLSRIVRWSLALLIVLNVLAAVLQTVEWIEREWAMPLYVFECFSVVVFTIEYSLRLWSCTLDERYKRPVLGRIRFALTPLLLIDFLAIAPFYCMHFFVLDLRMLRAFRLARLLRGLKIARYSESVQLLWRVLVAKREELAVTFITVGVVLVVASTIMYYAERDAQPEVFCNIPAAMWWGVGSLTTAGAGDMIPVTTSGKVLNAFILLLGIGLFALPAGILASGFVEELHRRRAPRQVCPHCGRVIGGASEPTAPPEHQ